MTPHEREALRQATAQLVQLWARLSTEADFGARRVSAAIPSKRKRYRYLSPKERKQVARRYSTGLSMPKVAREWDVSVPTVRRIVRQSGVRRRPAGGQRKLPEDARRRLAAYYRSGATARQVARLWRVSPPTVMRIAREHGVSKRVRR